MLLAAAPSATAAPSRPPESLARLAHEWSVVREAVTGRSASAGSPTRLGEDVLPALGEAASSRSSTPDGWRTLAREVDDALATAGATAVERVRVRCALVDALPHLASLPHADPQPGLAGARPLPALRDVLLPRPPESVR